MKFAAIFVLLLAVVATGLWLQLNHSTSFSPKAEGSVEFSIGPEEQVLSISQNNIPDFPYITVQTAQGLIGALAVGGVGGVEGNQREYQVLNPLGPKLGDLTPMVGFVKGDKRSDPDYGGVWLSGTSFVPKDNIIQGIYHAETHSGTDAPSLNNTITTTAYIRSVDGGKTWIKPNYPNNVLMTGVGNPDKMGGTDPDSLIQMGNDTYLYSFEFGKDVEYRGMSVAKTTNKYFGDSSKWSKYYCPSSTNCGFTEPAIGGKITVLPGLTGKSPVAFNSYLNKFIAINGDPLLINDTLQMSYSDDGISFKNYGEPLKLENSIGPGWVKVYSSLIGLNGTANKTDNQFYWYYVVLKRDPKTQEITDSTRYLMRRLVTILNPTISTSTNNVTTTDLYRYYNSKDRQHIYDKTDRTKMGEISNDFKDEGACCKLFTTQIDNTIPLYKVKNSTDFFMETNINQINLAESNGYQNKTILGYCYKPGKQPAGTVPLYRFYNFKDTDHFYTTEETERSKLIPQTGWSYEGIVCYVNPK